MYWELNIPAENSETSSVSITVEADNWFTALKKGLNKQGLDGSLVSNISCSVQPDNSVRIKNFINGSTYLLKPVDSQNSSTSFPTNPAAPGKRKRSSITPPADNISINDKMIQAFERMQNIYDLHTHDQVADFGLSLAMDLIQCETGSCMLLTPGKYELYVAAAKGSGADSFLERKVDINHGIVGFSTRMSAVVVVSDPENDPRFDKEWDERAGYKTKNLLSAPIQFEGHTVGAMLLLNNSHSAGFSQSDANTLSYLSGALAEYIEKSLPSREADFREREFLS
jgi:hypothetical protein